MRRRPLAPPSVFTSDTRRLLGACDLPLPLCRTASTLPPCASLDASHFASPLSHLDDSCVGVDDSTADNAVDPMASQLQMLNFEIALRRSDPNVKDCLRKVWDGGRARSSYMPHARPHLATGDAIRKPFRLGHSGAWDWREALPQSILAVAIVCLGCRVPRARNACFAGGRRGMHRRPATHVCRLGFRVPQ